MSDVTPIPKPAKRTKDKDFSKKVLAVSPRCVVCGMPATQAHHLKKRSHGGDDLVANGVGLDTLHHKMVEENQIRLTVNDLRPDNVEYLETQGLRWKFE